MSVSESIALLYEEHAQSLFAFLLNFTRNEADTRDLMQDVFLKLAKDPNLIKKMTEPRRYLLRLAHNLAVDLIRRRSVRRRGKDQMTQDAVEISARTSDPDEKGFDDALSTAMSELPEEQRAVVHLKLWEGMTFESIAAILDVPPNTAASRYRYGIDKLRNGLRPLYEEIK